MLKTVWPIILSILCVSLASFSDPEPKCAATCNFYYQRCVNECHAGVPGCPSECARSYNTCVNGCPQVAPPPQILPGKEVETLEEADLYYGAQVVNHVKKGEHFRVSALQETWASLSTLDGKSVKGWISLNVLKLVEKIAQVTEPFFASSCRVVDQNNQVLGSTDPSGNILGFGFNGQTVISGYVDQGGNIFRVPEKLSGLEAHAIGSIDLTGGILNAERKLVGVLDSSGGIIPVNETAPVGRVLDCQLSEPTTKMRASAAAMLFFFYRKGVAGTTWQRVYYRKSSTCEGLSSGDMVYADWGIKFWDNHAMTMASAGLLPQYGRWDQSGNALSFSHVIKEPSIPADEDFRREFSGKLDSSGDTLGGILTSIKQNGPFMAPTATSYCWLATR